ncbi:MAG: stage II sporulation protein R [Clostridia bacterium]|nr:stage II sporulation protein R [Clostridia bacterium]
MKSKICLAVCLVTVIGAFVLSIAPFAKSCENIRRDVLRLHIVADSDSQTDQGLKLLVRDEVLKKGGEIFDGTVTAAEAERIITPKTDELKAAAESILRQNGCNNSVEITVGEEYFATRCYENFTMPAGVYTAVRVNIGSAEGQNWWCVMFPPLCLPAASADADAFFTEDEMQVVSSSPEYEPRFKIVEIYESLKNRIMER